MINLPKWISLADIVDNNEEMSVVNRKTYETKANTSYRFAPINVVATAIKKCGLQVMDSFGATHLATEGDISDIYSIAFALDALDLYNHIKTHGSSFDFDQLDAASAALINFGWIEDMLPNFSTINPYYSNEGSQNSPTTKAMNSEINVWRNNAIDIGKKIFAAHPKFNVQQIADKVHVEMKARHVKGEKGMSGRGNQVPTADTIKRHALTGIKTQGIGAMP